MQFNTETKLTDILKEYPWLPDELVKIDGRFHILKTPVGKMMIKNATIADASQKTGLPVDVLTEQLTKMVSEHNEQ